MESFIVRIVQFLASRLRHSDTLQAYEMLSIQIMPGQSIRELTCCRLYPCHANLLPSWEPVIHSRCWTVLWSSSASPPPYAAVSTSINQQPLLTISYLLYYVWGTICVISTQPITNTECAAWDAIASRGPRGRPPTPSVQRRQDGSKAAVHPALVGVVVFPLVLSLVAEVSLVLRLTLAFKSTLLVL